jgi:hypothetical protein
MKKSVVYGSFCVLVSLLILFIIGCNKSGAPSCADESVKKIVLDIAVQEFRVQLFNQAMGVRVVRSYDDLIQLEKTNNETVVKNNLAAVDQQLSESKINLANIRTNEKRNDIKKCECGGDLTSSNGKTLPIKYIAQFTEEGKVYVEVSGLK